MGEDRGMVETLKLQLEEAKKQIEIATKKAECYEAKYKEEAREKEEAMQLVWQMIQRFEDNGAYTDRQFTYYSPEDLAAATCGFSDHFKIGEGGYGTVYKGIIDHTPVAVKSFKQDSLQGGLEFQHEIDFLSRIRHPHLVMMIGACPERGCIVYEYMSNGNLEDRLFCNNGTPPIPWSARLRIAAEVCEALLFLHNGKPKPTVHCDLKPANVLLDDKFVSKIGDFGLARLVSNDFSYQQTRFVQTELKGTLPYMDPDYIRTGEFTPRSDVYSFGVLVLQLLTGRPPFGLAAQVDEALDRGKLQEILDDSAGKWPLEQATQLAELALHCAERSRKQRPDLYPNVMKMLDKLRTSAIAEEESLSSAGQQALLDVLSFLLCPITQEIMKDPHVAADGFSYEFEAIKAWFDGGHQTSPMTNLRLNHTHLTPNHSLRSAIRQWRDKIVRNSV